MRGTLGLFLAATLLMSLSPGPNVFLLVSLGLRDGAAAVLKASAGIALASLLFLAVSALGLVAVFAASALLFRAVCYAGAAYLVYLGVRMLRGARRAAAGFAGAVRPVPRPFLQGFVTHLANPKAVLYWSALLPQFLDLKAALAPQVVLLGSLGIVLDVIVLSGYGLSAAAARRGAVPGRLQPAVSVAGGAFFICAGALLAYAQFRA
jgi:threonine/homoserine/homoserine lactone efflux protein